MRDFDSLQHHLLRRRALLAAIGTGLGFAAQAQPAGAGLKLQGPLRMWVGTPAGGTTDVIARLVSNSLADLLGQALVVENRPGVSGLIAADGVAKATPDGTTLLMAPSQLATYRALYKSATLDPEQDLTPIGLVATSPYVLVVHPSLPVKNFPELLAYAHAHPGHLSYGGSTPGSAQHLGWEAIKRATKIDMQYIPYKGTSALMPDLLAGRLHAAIDNVAVLTSYVKAGQLRGIAVTSADRTPMLPELPTVAASGIPGFQAMGWFGVFTSSRAPVPVVAALRAALGKATASAEVRQKLIAIGAEPQAGGAEAMRGLLKREVSTWTQVIRASGITLD
jgi:tripartite-type tricarboxylate transporter receptor subunit TctC